MERSRTSDLHIDRSRYFLQVHAFPMLASEVEQDLCRRWRDRRDISAAHLVVSSHLRLVMKIAREYRGYGLSSEDLIGEGQLGLMHAVSRFDPDRGVRFSTYAVWWVRAAICQYILHNWSLVRIASTTTQRKLFFNLRRARRNLQIFDGRALTSDDVAKISEMLQVPEHEVVTMDQRMASPDCSLDAPLGADGESDRQDYVSDDGAGQEIQLGDDEEATQRRSLLNAALEHLTARERYIVVARHLRDRPTTLADLSEQIGVSAQRVRQIELRAIEKLQRSVRRPLSDLKALQLLRRQRPSRQGELPSLIWRSTACA